MTYECTAGFCGGRITWSDVNGRPHQRTVYPRDKGPLSPAYQVHDCPVARGLRPPEIDRHPNARRV